MGINDKEQVFIEKEQQKVVTTLDEFPARIREFKERNPDSEVVVKGDARLTYGVVKKVMLDIKDAGYTQVGLITKKRDQALP